MNWQTADTLRIGLDKDVSTLTIKHAALRKNLQKTTTKKKTD